MTAPRPSPRRYRAASLLALLAVLAQLWMVQLSHLHVAQQASAGLLWGDICRAPGVGATQQGNPDEPTGMGGMACPACMVASLGLAPGPMAQGAEPLPVAASAPPNWHSAPRPSERERGMRPPAQAPPTALG